MTMRIAVGALLQESNTFAPARTTLADFEKTYCVAGPALLSQLGGTRVEVAGALATLKAADIEPVPLLAACGMAGGVVEDAAFQHLADGMLDRLREAGPVDGVYLALHGAMMTEGSADAESLLLRRVRAVIGDRPLVVSCDLHGNATPEMVALVDALIAYQLYPHDDAYETGERAVRLLIRIIRGEVKPVMVMRRAPMMVPGGRQLTRGPYPMAHLHDAARAAEASGRVLAASYMPTFSKFDGPDIGFRAVVVADGDLAAADRLALTLVEEAWRRRHDFEVPLVPVEDGIRAGLAVAGGPVVLVDAADCVGGGAAGDSAVVLAGLIAHAPDAPSAVLVNDAVTAAAAHEAGEGAVLRVAIGNRISPYYGPPVEAEARVVALSDGAFTYSAGLARGVTASMGRSALLAIGPVHAVVCSLASYEYGDDQIRSLGLDTDGLKFIVSKTVGNYVRAFPRAAAAFVLDTPGPQTHNLRRLPWKHINRPLYPWDDGFAPDFEAGRTVRLPPDQRT